MTKERFGNQALADNFVEFKKIGNFLISIKSFKFFHILAKTFHHFHSDWLNWFLYNATHRLTLSFHHNLSFTDLSLWVAELYSTRCFYIKLPTQKKECNVWFSTKKTRKMWTEQSIFFPLSPLSHDENVFVNKFICRKSIK